MVCLDPFDQEIREARRVIRNCGQNPEQFRIKRTPITAPARSRGSAAYYIVIVSCGDAKPATYEGGKGLSWIAALARDLSAPRFSEAGCDAR